ncbi:MAG: ribosomal protein L7/L12 [Candidatus Shikimatogenerans sp. JK-2022]|nr:ribosomal protein L7/L12 [Candidatus Shikimatogenerans bostrichidophilus]
MKNIKDIVKILVNLNIQEINEIINILANEYNIKLNNYNLNNNNLNNNINIEQNNINNNNNVNNNITKDIVDIYLKSISNIKLPVIKLIKDITGMSLTESKKCIDNIPCLIKKSIKLEEAKKIQEDFKKIDADIEIK